MGSRLLGYFQNFLHREVALLRGWRADVIGFICLRKEKKKKKSKNTLASNPTSLSRQRLKL